MSVESPQPSQPPRGYAHPYGGPADATEFLGRSAAVVEGELAFGS